MRHIASISRCAWQGIVVPRRYLFADVGAVAAAVPAAAASVGMSAGGKDEQTGGRIDVAGLPLTHGDGMSTQRFHSVRIVHRKSLRMWFGQGAIGQWLSL